MIRSIHRYDPRKPRGDRIILWGFISLSASLGIMLLVDAFTRSHSCTANIEIQSQFGSASNEVASNNRPLFDPLLPIGSPQLQRGNCLTR